MMLASVGAAFLVGIIVGALLARSRVVLKVSTGSVEIQAQTVREVATLLSSAEVRIGFSGSDVVRR